MACCIEAGIKEEYILSPVHPAPIQKDELCFVATDDTSLVNRDLAKRMQNLARLDATFVQNCIPKNTSKDVNVSDEIVGLGCHLTNDPPLVEPDAGKLYSVVCALVDLLDKPFGIPRAVNSLLGVQQWFNLLQRPMYSVVDTIYKFVRREPAHIVQKVPPTVLNELMTTLFLLPLLPAGLDRPFLPEIFTHVHALQRCPERYAASLSAGGIT